MLFSPLYLNKKTATMKLFITILCIFCMVNTNNSFAFAIGKPAIAERPDINHSTNNIKASELIKLSEKEFSLITGKKMNLWDRLSFSVLKMRMKHDLKNNPNLTISEYYAKKSSRHLSTWGYVGIVVIGVLLVLTILYIIYAGGGLG
jgi:hypothetical protein